MRATAPPYLLPAFLLGVALFHLRRRADVPATDVLSKGVTGVSCVRVMNYHQSHEGFGAIFKLNKIAVFLASYYEAKLHFAPIESIHDYNFHSLFSTCGVKEDERFPTRCVFNTSTFMVRMCRPGDCACLGEQFRSQMEMFSRRRCSTVGVVNDGYKRYEYSGCLSVLPRYFAAKGKPDWEYDAIHFRQGDLQSTNGRGKAFPKLLLKYFVDELCRASDRDIVIVTEGRPTVPSCGNRVILAADTSIQHAMNIFQYAKTVVIGVSSFAHVLMEFAKPERVVVPMGAATRFEYVDCEKWSVVQHNDGGVHRFNSKKDMIEFMSSQRELRDLKAGRKFVGELELSVPKRVWKKEMMRPARLFGE